LDCRPNCESRSTTTPSYRPDRGRDPAARARLWHGDQGASWAEIGDQLGVTRQAAQQRYGTAADQLLRETIRAGWREAVAAVRDVKAG
jgi:hypothetical protein